LAREEFFIEQLDDFLPHFQTGSTVAGGTDPGSEKQRRWDSHKGAKAQRKDPLRCEKDFF